jgi:multidrug resistance efflux pump
MPIWAFLGRLWKRFAALSRRTHIIIGVVAVIVIGGVLVLAHRGSAASTANALPEVTLQSIDSFGGAGDSVDVLGTVQSVSEADLLAQSAGTVESVNTTLGATVPAGFVIASLDGSAASAAVLQAQGGYDAALAAEKATALQANNSTGSFATEQTSVRNLYTSTYTTTEDALTGDVDQLFGDNTPVGPALLINPLTTNQTFPRERQSIDDLMANWEATLPTVSTSDPLALLATAQTNLTTVQTFINNLDDLATTQGSAATPAQLAALATAQSTINAQLAAISSAQTAYNAAETASEVGQTQSDTSGDTGVTSSEATVEEALGALRSAQAAYEKTIIRAPIAGTINYLDLHVGDYVTANQHVATVAHNNSLEVVMYLSQEDRNRIEVGDTLTIDGTYKGIVTTIAPALDPTTKQIEVDVAVDDSAALVDGQSVQVALPSAAVETGNAAASAAASTDSAATSSTTPTIEVPITAVKLLPDERDVFTVDSTGHLVAHPVTIGNVIGEDIQILTPLDPTLQIVTDARGLSAGDAVQVATSTADTSTDANASD